MGKRKGGVQTYKCQILSDQKPNFITFAALMSVKLASTYNSFNPEKITPTHWNHIYIQLSLKGKFKFLLSWLSTLSYHLALFVSFVLLLSHPDPLKTFLYTTSLISCVEIHVVEGKCRFVVQTLSNIICSPCVSLWTYCDEWLSSNLTKVITD